MGGRSQLVLTLTRQCNYSCTYCRASRPTSPALTCVDVTAAIDIFCGVTGGGQVKIFGGEPLLAPDVARHALREAARRAEIHRVTLSTNGLLLDRAWLTQVQNTPKALLAISLDGEPADHRRLRRAKPGEGDAYDRFNSLLPELVELPRLVVAQTIAPAAAARASRGFHHLLELGFRRFNFLPGYCLEWTRGQLDELRASFEAIGATIRARWAADERIYVRNLFTFAPVPFFNTGMVVDADRTLHASNIGLFSTQDHLLAATRIGTLDNPPSMEALAAKTREIASLLERSLPPAAWRGTIAADRELTRFCRALYPAYFAYRRRRRAA